jgi:hypothetical protein
MYFVFLLAVTNKKVPREKMQNLSETIERIYSTTSDVERREVMARLNAYFASSPDSWMSLLGLFVDALSKSPASLEEQKRKQRISFFAANALLGKIRRESLNHAQKQELAETLSARVVAQDPIGQALVRTTTSKRCL